VVAMPATKRGVVAPGSPAIFKPDLYRGKAILLDVPDEEGFMMTFRSLGEDEDHFLDAYVGIVDLSAKLGKMVYSLSLQPKHGFFLQLLDGSLCAQDGTHQKDSGINMDQGQTLRMCFRKEPQPALLFGVNEAVLTEVHFNSAIPPGQYCPCMILEPGVDTTMAVTTCEAPSKRRPPVALERMWEERNFTDGTVVCDGQTFPVHRAVLSVASPFFAAAFGGQMREATSAQLEIPDAPACAVEAVLRFVYTDALEPQHAAAVLPLAHRLELDSLVGRCAEVLFHDLSAASVAEVVRVLRGFREHASVAPVWENLLRTVQRNDRLFRIAMESG